MKRLLIIALLVFSVSGAVVAQVKARRSSLSAVTYGTNPSAGRTFVHDGVTFYYEIYGSGEPLLLIHGNGGSIADFSHQVDASS
ncbi:MAG TPA: hypothetical protein VGQ39_12745 [Pyrinomonadaceae bacterium]|jgi:hypothetical protein|nr:hypothetical protein [Pyrinomonadaceae bacterium]